MDLIETVTSMPETDALDVILLQEPCIKVLLAVKPLKCRDRQLIGPRGSEGTMILMEK